MSTEARVGAFVLAALAVLVGFVLALGDFSLTPGVKVYADFGYTGGLQVGAPVKISGIKVGRVTDLRLLRPDAAPPAATASGIGQTETPVVRTSVVVEQEFSSFATTDAAFAIGTMGVIGESYIELQPGSGPELGEGTAVRGYDSPKLHWMALQLSTVLGAVAKLVGGQSEMDLGAVGDAVAALLNTANDVVGERREELKQAIGDMALVARDLRVVMGEVRRATAGGRLDTMLGDGQATLSSVRNNLPALMASAQDSLTAVEALSTKANTSIDPEAIGEIIADAQAATARLEKISRDAEAIVASIERGEGTVGGLLTDSQIYDDLKEMLRDLKRNPWKFLWRD